MILTLWGFFFFKHKFPHKS